jgi:hypothetical protein
MCPCAFWRSRMALKRKKKTSQERKMRKLRKTMKE